MELKLTSRWNDNIAEENISKHPKDENDTVASKEYPPERKKKTSVTAKKIIRQGVKVEFDVISQK